MKKRITILTLNLLFATAVKAQIFIDGDEVNELRNPVPVPSEWVNNPQGYNQGVDAYTPVGSGLLLLAAMGGAYLVGKRKKAPDER